MTLSVTQDMVETIRYSFQGIKVLLLHLHNENHPADLPLCAFQTDILLPPNTPFLSSCWGPMERIQLLSPGSQAMKLGDSPSVLVIQRVMLLTQKITF